MDEFFKKGKIILILIIFIIIYFLLKIFYNHSKAKTESFTQSLPSNAMFYLRIGYNSTNYSQNYIGINKVGQLILSDKNSAALWQVGSKNELITSWNDKNWNVFFTDYNLPPALIAIDDMNSNYYILDNFTPDKDDNFGTLKNQYRLLNTTNSNATVFFGSDITCVESNNSIYSIVYPEIKDRCRYLAIFEGDSTKFLKLENNNKIQKVDDIKDATKLMISLWSNNFNVLYNSVLLLKTDDDQFISLDSNQNIIYSDNSDDLNVNDFIVLDKNYMRSYRNDFILNNDMTWQKEDYYCSILSNAVNVFLF